MNDWKFTRKAVVITAGIAITTAATASVVTVFVMRSTVPAAATRSSTAPAAASAPPIAAWTPPATTPLLTAEQIASRMHIGHVFAYNAKNDPNELLGRQGEYTSKVNWGAATSDDSNNSIEVFKTKADMMARANYLSAFNGTMLADGYDFSQDSYLLRLSIHYTPDQANAIENQFLAVTTGK